MPPTERISESFIEIRDREYRDLITVIELLSPTNKTLGPDRDLYLAKRKLLTAGNVHFVEIDLLRGGARMPVEGLAQCDYAIMVSRSYERPQVGLWPMKLRTPSSTSSNSSTPPSKPPDMLTTSNSANHDHHFTPKKKF